ncbi:MAG TPA: FtsX-like permease family protein, partial [Gemmataceae bacterium]|nr:FtsX-like permease family protein [Gemmataceae bacterium]
MTTRRLLWRNLRFHWRGNLAVVLGVAVATAVLTGALLVGDSLRGSLRERAEEQRAGIDFALLSPRFIEPISPKARGLGYVDSAIIFKGSAQAGEAGNARNLNGVTIIGMKSGGFLPENDSEDEPPWTVLDAVLYRLRLGPAKPGPALIKVVIAPWPAKLSSTVARRLGIDVGDQVVTRVALPGSVPRESLLGRRDEENASASFSWSISETVSQNSPLARFQLAPGAQEPQNIVVPLELLQGRLEFGKKINFVVAKGGTLADYQRDLPNIISLDDWAIRVEAPGRYLSVESTESILSPAVAGAVERAAKRMDLAAAPTLVYLANSISHDKQSIPYSVVAALDPAAPPPLGPFLPEGVTPLADNEIILADWKDSPLKDVPVGSTITLTYFEPELVDGQLRERQAEFRLKGRVPFDIDRPDAHPTPMRTAAADPHLTPGFPGITDKLSIRDWKPPFPFDNKRIQKRDEQFWQKHKATPKAYVTLAAGQKLWASRYGKLTSIRLAVPDEDSAKVNWEERTNGFKKVLHEELRPEEGGFMWQDLRARADAASEGGQDYGMLFLSFSFFLIVSALMLTGLLVQLNLQRRASEIGLLLATGWSRMRVLLLLLVEILLLSLIGSLLGLLLAIAFGQGMLALMARLWPDASAGSFLHFHATGLSLAIGFFATLLIGSLTIIWGLFILFRVSPSALLAGVTTVSNAVFPTQVGHYSPSPPAGERGPGGEGGERPASARFLSPSPPSPLPRSGGEGS